MSEAAASLAVIAHPATSVAEWARAIVALPVVGVLPERTVLVGGEAQAHALRRQLVAMGAARALVGTRFLTPVEAARQVVAGAGMVATPGEEGLRALRLWSLLRRSPGLRYFQAEQLVSSPGWEDAFDTAISDLERAGVTPVELEAADDGSGQLCDLAALWRAVDVAAHTSWSRSRFLVEAAGILHDRGASAWPLRGPVLAAVGAEISAVEARFVRVIPGIVIAPVLARPARGGLVRRLGLLLGDIFARELSPRPAFSGAPAVTRRELDVLRANIFEPEALGRGDRAHSLGPDGSVELEEHAGVEAELEAARDWVGRLVLDERVPLSEIAIIVPHLEPLAGMVADYLGRAGPSAGDPSFGSEPVLPVHVAGGLPLLREAGALRVLAIIRALRAHLEIESFAAILPYLRLDPPEGGHLSASDADLFASSLGTVGGCLEIPGGARMWASRTRSRLEALTTGLAALPAGSDPDVDEDHEIRQRRRLAVLLGALLPALDALDQVVATVMAGEPLPTIWPTLRSFFEQHVLLPGAGARVPALLEGVLDAVAGETCEAPAGFDALAVLEDALHTLRVPTRRFGEPAVFVGTIASAAALSFRAVRLLGLCEGSFPSVPRDNPALPEAARRRFAPALLDAKDRAGLQLQLFDRLVRNITGSLVLSAPRRTLDGTDREPSFLLLEVAAALGRPDAGAAGSRTKVVPDSAALRRTAFEPARRHGRRWRRDNPVSPAAWLDRAAHLGSMPRSWATGGVLDLARLQALASPDAPGPMDGLLGPGIPDELIPGLTANKPISASALGTLLECPHRFLLERLFHLQRPRPARAVGEVDPMTFGSMLHTSLEVFYRAHGATFASRSSRLAEWQALATEMAGRVFEARMDGYPLAGEGAFEQQRQRLARSVASFLRLDWSTPGQRFVDVERRFGYDRPLSIPAGERSLYVRGSIDRIDQRSGVTVVRDMKSGKVQSRRGKHTDPRHGQDIQIALYGMVVQALAAAWKLPARVEVSYQQVGRGETARSFDDFAMLGPALARWLAVASDLLTARAFPRTPDDCGHCPFTAACGPDRNRRGRSVMAAAPVLGRFGQMKDSEGRS